MYICVFEWICSKIVLFPQLDITGMKDESVQQLFISYVNSNGATIGTTIGDLINTNYGADINKFVVPAINAICKDL